MNLLRLIYILKSEFVFFIAIFIFSIFIDLILQFFSLTSEKQLFKNIYFSIFLSSYFSLLLSVNEKIITRFINYEKTKVLKINFSVLYILIHVFLIYLLNYFIFRDLIIDNIQIIYLIILIVLLIITNIRFKLNEKKQLLS